MDNKTGVTLLEENNFEFLNGLWSGKKPPYSKAIVIRNTNFKNDGQIDYTKVAVLDVETKQLETRKLKKGDIIIERSGGGPKQPVGRVVYFDIEPETDYSFSNFTSAIRIKNLAKYDPKYIFYFLHNFYSEGKTDQLQRRTTGIRNLDYQSYKESVILPQISLNEQKRISQILTVAQKAISEQEILLVKLKELKRSSLRHLFTYGISGEKTKIMDIGEIPNNWSVMQLGDTGIVSYGIQAAVASLLKPIGFKILTNKNITLEGEIVFDKINYYEPKSKRELSSFIEKGDLLLNWRSGSKEHVGKTAIYFGNEKLLHSSFILRIRTNPKLVLNKYLHYYLNYLREDGYFVKLQTYAVNAKFNKSSVLNMNIPVPPIAEQSEIVKIADSVSEKLYLSQSKLKVYQELFKTLLQELMSRKINVNEYE